MNYPDPEELRVPHVPVKSVWVPSDVELVEYQEEICIGWVDDRGTDAIEAVHEGFLPVPARGERTACLNVFIRLASRPDPSKVLAFARRWGVLGICEHDLPASHSPLTRQRGPGGHCYPRGYYESSFSGGFDPLRCWHSYAAQALAILKVAESLRHQRQPNPGDWETAFSRSYSPASNSPLNTRMMLMQVVNRWLEWGDVRPQAAWSNDGKSLTLTLGTVGAGMHPGGNLFGLLAIQLAATVAGARGIEFCGYCGDAFTPQRSHQRFCSTPCRENYFYKYSSKSPKYKKKVGGTNG